MTHFTNQADKKQKVVFAASYPGHVLPLDLDLVGGEIKCQKDAFLCAAHGSNTGVALDMNLGTGFFGGEGLFLATLEAAGTVYLQTLPFARLVDRIAVNIPSNSK